MNKRRNEIISYIFAAAAGAVNIFCIGPFVPKEDGGWIAVAFGTVAVGGLTKVAVSRALKCFDHD